MKKCIFPIIFLLLSTLSWSNDTKFIIYDETAIIPTKSQINFSLFSNSEFAINESLSIRVHPIMFFLSPSFEVKYNFINKDNFYLSSCHSISYPTILWNIIKNKGTGGVISPEFNIPNLFSLSNGLIASYQLSDNHIITGIISFEFALNTKHLAPGTSIDLPIILPRTMVYYKDFGTNLTFTAEGKLSSAFDYHLKNYLFYFPFKNDKYDYEYQLTSNQIFNELSASLFWKICNNFKIGIGGMLCYGEYPFGTQWHFIPFIDFKKIIE